MSADLTKLVFPFQNGVFFGGLPIAKDEQVLKSNCPHIVVGTPGRVLALVRSKKLNLKNIKHFILDECDKMLEQLGKSNFPVTSSTVKLDHDSCTSTWSNGFYFYIIFFSSSLQIWGVTFRRFSGRHHTRNKSWCSQPHSPRTSGPSARSLCKTYVGQSIIFTTYNLLPALHYCQCLDLFKPMPFKLEGAEVFNFRFSAQWKRERERVVLPTVMGAFG